MGDERMDSFEESEETDDSLPTPPDGRWGWVIVMSSFMVHFIADGLAFSFGILYVELLDYFGESKGKTAWIGSLFVGIPLLAGPIAGALTNKFGCRVVTMAGSVVSAAGFIASSYSDSVEVLCFFFGIVSGVGLACVYVPAIVIVAFYFDTKRAFATGIAVSGSGIGTFVFAPLTEYLLNQYGWRGTMLLFSGILLNMTVLGALYRPLETPLAEKKRKYFQAMQKFSKMVSKPTENGQKTGSPMSLAKHHILSKSMQDFSACTLDAKSNNLLRNTGESTSNSHTLTSSMDNLDILPIGTHGSAYSVTPVNNAGKPTVESRMTLSPMLRKDIFYRGSVIRLNIPRNMAKSCPELNTGSAQKEKPKTICGCFKCITPAAIKQMLDYSLFKNVVFDLFFFSNLLLYMWYDIPYIYLADQAQSLGIPVAKASFLISIIGIVSTIGQLTYGYLGDLEQVNTVLIYSISTAVCGIATILLPFAHLYELICVYGVCFGFTLSANYTLETIVIVELLGLDQLTNAYGLVMCGQGVANLLGPPTAGWLWDYTGNYNWSFYTAGIGILFSGGMVFLMHLVLNKRKKEHKETTQTTTVHVMVDESELKKEGITQTAVCV